MLHNLSEHESTKVSAQLSGRGIGVFREKQPDGRWTISVASEQMKDALKLIESRRLLPDERRLPDDSSSLLSSREEQRFKFERSLSREIEGTIGALDGVLDARVHLNLPPVDPLLGQPLVHGKGTASVLIIAGPELKALPSEIGSLVSGASGVPLDYVSVLVSKAEAPDPEPTAQGGSKLDEQPRIEQSRELQLTPTLESHLLEGTLSVAILVIGLGAMGRAYRARPKREVRIDERSDGLQLEGGR